MSARRLLAVSASTLLLGSGLALVGAAAPAQAADHQLEACGPSVPKPCVLTFTRNGSTSTGAFNVGGIASDAGGEKYVSVSIDKNGGDNGGYDLGAPARSDVFSVTLDMGSWVPRIAAGKARDVTVTRSGSGSSYQVTITGKPVLLSGQCDQSSWPWRCPEADVVVNDPVDFNNVQWDALWDAQIYDAGFVDDASVRRSLFGLDYFHNFAASAIPPNVRFDGPDDTATISTEIANRRYLDDGTTLVRGHAEMRIPDSFLAVGYGITDPSTMTGGSLAVAGSGSGATTSVTHDAADGAVHVLVDNMTFPDIMVADGELRQRAATSSARVLKVKRGVITPTKGKIASTERVTAAKGKVEAKKSTARGAKVTGYQARCTAGRSTVTGKSKTRTVVLTGLQRGRAYSCKVRALSKAGPGSYSKAKGLAARP